MNAQRRRLPDRRRHEVIEFDHGGFRYAAGLGRFDDGNLAEVFLDVSAKVGTAVEAAARDAAVTVSIALQHGVPIQTLRRALTRDGVGNAAGPVGRLLDLLDEGESS